jgi:hypothetical protein
LYRVPFARLQFANQ